MIIFDAMDGFFFRRISARMFGVMRIAWASIAGLYLLFQLPYVSYYYSEAGILPQYLEHIYERHDWRFTILDYVTQPFGVECMYVLLLACLLCTALGVRTRLSLIASVLLLFSFHERNGAILSGGDTLLRNIGFIMMFTPGIDAFSLDRAKRGWTLWKKNKTLPPATMPIWAWRLLLWQMIVIYATSFWTKMLGAMWRDGTAIQVTLHHPLFSRFPVWFINHVLPMSPLIDYVTLAWQAAWLLLLVPAVIADHVQIHIPLRRILIIIGIFFHLAIFILMDAGVFSLAVFVAYIGLLREDDLQWLKKVMRYENDKLRETNNYSRNSKLETSRSPIVVLYDGHCGLCMRSTYILELCDWLKMLTPVNFRNESERKKVAPHLHLKDLDRSMHILIPTKFSILNSQFSILTGFDAFRYMTKKLPPLWPAYPLLWIPGVAPIGRMLYAHIAERRKKCDHEHCTI